MGKDFKFHFRIEFIKIYYSLLWFIIYGSMNMIFVLVDLCPFNGKDKNNREIDEIGKVLSNRCY